MGVLAISSGITAVLTPENSSQVTSVMLGENSTLILQGAPLNVTSIETDSGARICGSGKIIVSGPVTVGQGCVIDLSEIELIIGRMFAPNTMVMRVGERSSLILGDYPITGLGNKVKLIFENTVNYTDKDGNPDTYNVSSIKFEAPCRQAFKNITIEGKVLTEEAYPEWFMDGEEADGALAINKAFDLTQNGVVRLQSKLYHVASTIYVPARGQLLGTGSGWWQDTIVDGEKRDLAGTVILISESAKPTSFDGRCVVLVNYVKTKVEQLIKDWNALILKLYKEEHPKSEKDTFEELTAKEIKEIINKYNTRDPYWYLNYFKKPEIHLGNQGYEILNSDFPYYQIEWPGVGGKIANIYFANRDYGTGEERPLKLCCILVSGCMAFDQLTFRQFRNAIVWANQYADQKEVTRCYFNHDRYQSEEDDPYKDHYLLDFGNVGDALVCRGNSFNSESSTGARFLRIHQCFGGSIADNIINGDVDISGCKGLDFTGNHLENGAQLAITSSVINLSNNYFEKGLRPNIVIKSDINMHAPVVNLINNSFVYRPFYRPLLENGKWNEGKWVNEEWLNGKWVDGNPKGSLPDVCDYDIVFKGIVRTIDENQYYEHGPVATVNISNTMRYSGKNVRDTYSMGIKIGKQYEIEGEPGKDYDDPEAFENFNYYCPLKIFLSRYKIRAAPICRSQP